MPDGKVLKGVALSPGVAIGPVYLIDKQEPEVVAQAIGERQVKGEIERFNVAIDEAKVQISELRDKVVDKGAAGIFGVHLLILDDPAFARAVDALIEDEKINAEAALDRVTQSWEQQFLNLNDPTHRERVLDLRDVRNRMLRILLEREQEDLERGEGKFIIVARELLPSTAVHFDTTRLLGIVTELGGAASHAAILARSFGIPAVSGIEGLGQRVGPRCRLVVDGRDGMVVINPSTDQVEEYEPRVRSFAEWTERIHALDPDPAVTPDGVDVEIQMNVENFTILPENSIKASQGVGLYRTEFLFMGRDSFPSEEEQYEAYRSVVEKVGGVPVTFRTIDIGGDKPLSYLKTPVEENPVMGWRGIRISFEWPDVFYAQLRALIRVGRHGPCRIMLPMVSTLDEVLRAKSILGDLYDDLVREAGKEGVEPPPKPSFGIMIEVPSSAICVDQIIDHVDFVSIGTNDLVQYVMAVDRNNLRVQNLYQPFNPAVVRLLRDVIETGNQHDVSVSVCGEMSGQLESALLLIGLGLRSLSMNPLRVPILKEMIRAIPHKEAERVAKMALQMSSAEEIQKLLRDELRELACDLSRDWT